MEEIKHLSNPQYSQFIALSRYARWLPEENRRESWEETVSRYIDFFKGKFPTIKGSTWSELFSAIYNMEVMPSMRALMTAGEALDRDNVAGFNCSALPIQGTGETIEVTTNEVLEAVGEPLSFTIRNPICFDEAMYILMCGAGVGFSVERQFINNLPKVGKKLTRNIYKPFKKNYPGVDKEEISTYDKKTNTISVHDSKYGWSSSLRILIIELYNGNFEIEWNVSKVREKGAPLKTFGGRASGPQPLEELFLFVKEIFKKANGRKLTSIECHDIVCKIGAVVVVGGVRRCLPTGSLVHTKNGMVGIEHTEVGDYVLTSNGYDRITNKFEQGVQKLVEVSTQDSSFRCTPNHRVAVLTGIDEYEWREVSTLDTGDRLLAPSISIDGWKTSLPEFTYTAPKHSTTCKDITIPELDEDMAWLLGVVQGDGYVYLTQGKGSLSIPYHHNEHEIGMRVKSQLERFGVNVGTLEYDNYSVHRSCSKQLAMYLHSFLKQPKVTLKVPDFIWSATQEIKLAYVSGIMDADGSIKTRPVCVVTSIYEGFVNELQILLSSCGVQSRIKPCSLSGLKDNWQPKFNLVLINTISKETFNSIPTLWKKCHISDTERNTNSYPKEFLDFTYPNNYPWSKTDGRLIPVSVVSVEDVAGEEQTWDIEVAGSNEFFCNGYLVHNSACISLSNLTDGRMQSAKSGDWWMLDAQRALANNSVAYTEKPDIGIFMKEFLSLYESKSGERGIFNREAAERKVLESGRRSGGYDWLTNPCCFTGDMRLLTQDGYKYFNNLSELPIVHIVNNNGDITEGSVWSSGKKPVVEVRFRNRDSITCTPDHLFMNNKGEEVQAGVLKGHRIFPEYYIRTNFQDFDESNDAFLSGFIQGDGNTCRLNSVEHKGLEVYFGRRDGDIANMYNQEIGTWYSRYARDIAKKWELSSEPLPTRTLPHTGMITSSFLSGLYSANGCVVKGHRVAFKSTCKLLIQQLKEELSLLDIDSYITTNKSKKVRFSNGDYVCKESYDLNISRFESLLNFAEDISFGQEYKRKDLEALILSKAPMVTSIRDMGVQEVFDFTEPETHWGIVEGCVVHNSEIILRPEEFCNLSEVVVREDDTYFTLMKKVELATILGTLQSSLTDFKYLNPKWSKNTKEEALLGVSLTGIMDHPILSGTIGGDKGLIYLEDGYSVAPPSFGDIGTGATLPDILEELKNNCITTNKEWSDKLGLNQSTAITCVKPSGTVSQLVDSASGIHARFAPYYIRTVRADKKDPLSELMIDRGIPHEENVMEGQDSWVFSFPMKSPEGAILNDERSALDQLEHWLVYQRHWCEHKPSVTIFVKEDEWLEVGAWVYAHFDEVSGISFLPHSDHSYQQAPYQEIDEGTFLRLSDEMPKDIDWSLLSEFEKMDTTAGSSTLACTGSVCEMVDLTNEDGAG